MTNDLIRSVKDRDADGARAAAAGDPAALLTRDDEGLLPAVHALYRGDEALARDLLPPDGQLTVFEAAMFGRVDRVRALLAADPGLARAWSPDGFTALHLAIFGGDATIAELLLDAGSDVEAASRSETARLVRPLHTAVFARQPWLAILLLDRGADPNASESGGFTPLHTAVENGDPEVVRILLERGANPAARAEDGRTPVELAQASGDQDVVAAVTTQQRRTRP